MKAWQGSVAVSQYTGVVSPAYYVYKITDAEIYPLYLHYLLRSCYKDEFRRLSGGIRIGQWDLPSEALENTLILQPSPTEQQQIVHFLDRKCTAIDTAIEKTKKSIEKLEEYKKAVITNAVTKGIDPNAKMKDSGVEWIGEIPEDWEVIKLKYLLKDSMKYGATETGIEYSEELPRYIRITDITSDNKLKDSGKLSLTEQQAEKYLLKEDTILFARSGATVGKTFLYKTEYGRAAFAGYMISAIPNNDKLLATWLYYYTLSFSYADWVKRSFLQATIQNICLLYTSSAFALFEWFPTILREPLSASDTPSEATAPVKLPARHCPPPRSWVQVRNPILQGWYPNSDSHKTGVLCSTSPTYPVHTVSNPSIKLE